MAKEEYHPNATVLFEGQDSEFVPSNTASGSSSADEGHKMEQTTRDHFQRNSSSSNIQPDKPDFQFCQPCRDNFTSSPSEEEEEVKLKPTRKAGAVLFGTKPHKSSSGDDHSALNESMLSLRTKSHYEVTEDKDTESLFSFRTKPHESSSSDDHFAVNEDSDTESLFSFSNIPTDSMEGTLEDIEMCDILNDSTPMITFNPYIILDKGLVLTERDEETVKAFITATESGNSILPAARFGTSSITKKNVLERLKPGSVEFLSDDIIDFYGSALNAREQYLQRSTHNLVFSCQFFHSKHNYGWGKRQVPGGDIFTLDRLIIPIVAEDHFSCLVIFMKRKTIVHLNSMPGKYHNAKHYFDKTKNFLKQEWARLKKHDIEHRGWEDWNLLSHSNLQPLQSDGFSCGIFTCLNMKHSLDMEDCIEQPFNFKSLRLSTEAIQCTGRKNLCLIIATLDSGDGKNPKRNESREMLSGPLRDIHNLGNQSSKGGGTKKVLSNAAPVKWALGPLRDISNAGNHSSKGGGTKEAPSNAAPVKKTLGPLRDISNAGNHSSKRGGTKEAPSTAPPVKRKLEIKHRLESIFHRSRSDGYQQNISVSTDRRTLKTPRNPNRGKLNAPINFEALPNLRTFVTTALDKDSVKTGPFDGGNFTRATGYKGSRLNDQKSVFRMATLAICSTLFPGIDRKDALMEFNKFFVESFSTEIDPDGTDLKSTHERIGERVCEEIGKKDAPVERRPLLSFVTNAGVRRLSIHSMIGRTKRISGYEFHKARMHEMHPGLGQAVIKAKPNRQRLKLPQINTCMEIMQKVNRHLEDTAYGVKNVKNCDGTFTELASVKRTATISEMSRQYVDFMLQCVLSPGTKGKFSRSLLSSCVVFSLRRA